MGRQCQSSLHLRVRFLLASAGTCSSRWGRKAETTPSARRWDSPGGYSGQGAVDRCKVWPPQRPFRALRAQGTGLSGPGPPNLNVIAGRVAGGHLSRTSASGARRRQASWEHALPLCIHRMSGHDTRPAGCQLAAQMMDTPDPQISGSFPVRRGVRGIGWDGMGGWVRPVDHLTTCQHEPDRPPGDTSGDHEGAPGLTPHNPLGTRESAWEFPYFVECLGEDADGEQEDGFGANIPMTKRPRRTEMPQVFALQVPVRWAE